MPIYSLTALPSDRGSVEDRPAPAAPEPFVLGQPGELIHLVASEIVEAAVADTRAFQPRLWHSPARVVFCLLLAACLFPAVDHGRV